VSASVDEAKALHESETGQQTRKEKVVVVFRLALSSERRIAGIPGVGEVGTTYALRALAKEGRAVLRRLSSTDELTSLTDHARVAKAMTQNERTVGEPMTVYVQPPVLGAMHHAIGDPWKVEPRASIVGAYLTAIVTRLIETRQAG
jgi:hypothetical protein